MKKYVAIGLVSIVLIMSGCNQQIVDLNYKYNKAILIEGNDRIEFDIKSWNDYDDSDMVQFTTTDGAVYYTHSSNVIFIMK